MLVSAPDRSQQTAPRFDALMALYEANFEKMRILLQLDFDGADCLISTSSNSPDLYLDVLERHRYTSVVRLSYVLNTDNSGLRAEPDVIARIYHDAQQVEVTSFRPGAVVRALCGPGSPAPTAFRQRWRMNRFLDKWLEYLLDCGHSAQGWVAGPGIAALSKEPENITNGLTNRIPECPQARPKAPETVTSESV